MHNQVCPYHEHYFRETPLGYDPSVSLVIIEGERIRLSKSGSDRDLIDITGDLEYERILKMASGKKDGRYRQMGKRCSNCNEVHWMFLLEGLCIWCGKEKSLQVN